MITTPTSFTHDFLSGLKFKELQKLSVQYHVNKRWAKKQELIDNLLALREKDKAIKENKQEDEIEWRDGSTIFNDKNCDTSNDANRRLTFNIPAKTSADAKTHQTPLEPKNNEEALLTGVTNSRETYNIPPSKTDFNVQPLTESRATFDIPPKTNLLDETDPRATYDVPQNGKKLLEENELDEGIYNLQNSTHSQGEVKNFAESEFKEKLKKIQFDINIKEDVSAKNCSGMKSQVKMLTIPYARVTRRTRKDGEASKNDSSPIKMSKKSINIKKCTRPAVSKSPALSSVKKSMSLTKPQSVGDRRPLKLQFAESAKAEAADEKCKKALRRGAPRTSEEVPERRPSSVRVNLRAVPPSVTKNTKAVPVKDAKRLSAGSGQTLAACKPTLATKPITATKMPDFNKIHKKHFDQMDSLHDYVKKKEDRIRKLFGTPQPGQQLQAHNRHTPLFRFRSGTEKENLNNLATPLKRKDHDAKGAQKEAFKSKLPPSKPQSGIKDKNRSHIHGVRTNKRFELQMKLRNM